MNGKQLLTETYRRALHVVGGHGWGETVPVRTLNRWLTTRAFPRLRADTALVHGHVMRLDPRDSLGLSIWGTWEPFQSELVQSLVKPGATVLDVGANIGYYTLLLARGVGAHGQVYAFEPAPVNVSLLRENVVSNGYANVIVEAQAVSDHIGSAELVLSSENYGDHRLRDYAGGATATVQVTTLDEYFRSHPEPLGLIKVDVQGAELRVLRGMRELLARQAQWTLLLEFFPAGLEELGDEPAELLTFLWQVGFSIQQVLEKTRTLCPVESHWYAREQFGAAGFTNLLCTRKQD